jgi:hypothetical protein
LGSIELVDRDCAVRSRGDRPAVHEGMHSHIDKFVSTEKNN